MTINQLLKRIPTVGNAAGISGDAEICVGGKPIESVGLEKPNPDNGGKGRLIIETTDPDTWRADCRILPVKPGNVTSFPLISKN